eukprot:5279578-Pyramimonas_sp.AAC.1
MPNCTCPSGWPPAIDLGGPWALNTETKQLCKGYRRAHSMAVLSALQYATPKTDGSEPGLGETSR